MFGIRLARGTVVAIGAICAVLMLGFNNSASASALIYSNSDANVKVTGGDAVALNSCINDAKDGIIQTQQNSCFQVASAGNIVQLEDASVWVFSSSCFCGLPLFSASHVTVEVSGGLAAAANLCVNDAQDGFIQTQQNSCAQYATAGNIVALSHVSVNIYQ